MNCSLIITTYNWPEALRLVLSSINDQSILPNEIIIADDGSRESTRKLIEEYKDILSIPTIHSWQEDYGFRLSKSRNRAIALASYEYIIVVDGDMVLHKDFVKDHKRFAQEGIYVQGSRVLLQEEFSKNLFEQKKFIQPTFFSKEVKNKINLFRLPLLSIIFSYFKNQNINRVRGCNFSLFKKDIIKVNGFNEEFKKWGKEDSEFVQRLFNSGIYRKNLKFSGIQYHLYHKEGFADNCNIDILNNTIKKKIKRCSNGIKKYL